MECSIKHLKGGKVAGHDNIKSDYILIEQGNLKFVILTLFNKLYEIGYFPKEWSTGVIVPIYKKGDKKKPENYRGITLTLVVRLPGVPGSPRRTRRRLPGVPGSKKKKKKKIFFFFSKLLMERILICW